MSHCCGNEAQPLRGAPGCSTLSGTHAGCTSACSNSAATRERLPPQCPHSSESAPRVKECTLPSARTPCNGVLRSCCSLLHADTWPWHCITTAASAPSSWHRRGVPRGTALSAPRCQTRSCTAAGGTAGAASVQHRVGMYGLCFARQPLRRVREVQLKCTIGAHSTTRFALCYGVNLRRTRRVPAPVLRGQHPLSRGLAYSNRVLLHMLLRLRVAPGQTLQLCKTGRNQVGDLTLAGGGAADACGKVTESQWEGWPMWCVGRQRATCRAV